MSKRALHAGAGVAAVLSVLGSGGAHADTGAEHFQESFPKLVHYLNFTENLQLSVYEEIVATNKSDEFAIGKALMLEQVTELQKTEESHYHTAGNHLATLSPYRVFESRAMPGMLAMIRRQDGLADRHEFVSHSEAVPAQVVEILQKGDAFVIQILDIYLDKTVADKGAAVDAALAHYLQDSTLSVPIKPKSSDLLSKHQYAYSFRVGFPQLSGLTWASQWLQLAVLETVMAGSEQTLESDLNMVIELYERKLAPTHGTMLQLPTDIPTTPVIAPTLFNRHQAVAYIIDNLAAFEVVVGDVLAYPDVADLDEAIEEIVKDYTSKDEEIDDDMSYLEFVLRGGIYNQGGPATGGMEESERNQSRAATGAGHSAPTYTMF